MIETRKGNLLEQTKGVIIHGCNCQGVMSSGIALQIRNKWPGVFETYIYDLRAGMKLGDISIHDISTDLTIVSALTQEKYGSGRNVDYEAVVHCFEKINRHFSGPIMFPSIGAGLGGGNWNIIKTIIDETVKDPIQKIHFIL